MELSFSQEGLASICCLALTSYYGDSGLIELIFRH